MDTPLAAAPSWVKDAVFYQIFPDRFAKSDTVHKPGNLESWESEPTYHGYKGGDLVGIAEKLDWLADLGVTAIYLNPIFRSGANHRYHTHDYFSVDPLLGGERAFDTLMAACKKRNIRVVLDGVFNHASRGFFQFHDILENGPGSPWLDWFQVHNWPLRPYDDTTPPQYSAWWGIKALPKFNTDNPDVREYLMRVGEYWAAKGIDGWRLDVPEEITTPGFWEEFRMRVRAVNPDLYIVGEIWADAGAYINSGNRFDGTMNYRFTAATIAFVLGYRVDESLALDNPFYDIRPAIDAATYGWKMRDLLDSYSEQGNLASLNLLDSHDTARIISLANGDVQSVVLALVLLLTFPGAPSIYYGTEVGLEGRTDPDCRRAFPWDDQDSWNNDLLETTRSLVALRAGHQALRSSSYDVISPSPDEGGQMMFVFRRSSEDETLLVAVNAGDDAASVVMTLPGAEFGLVWGEGAAEQGDNNVRLNLAARSAAVWTVK
ncbi:MAG: DUF3459 domain-containing protein [Acidimicrobiia bacterium]|nr:DUF3459 domain-containing protein [Acidimicrobiia bacterium]